MNGLRQFLCGTVIVIMAATAITDVCAQSAPTRQAFLAYKDGATPEQEYEDRTACHEWAVAQSGFDPAYLHASARAWIAGAGADTRPTEDRRYPAPGGIASAQGSADVIALNEIHDRYLRAGRVCLEAKGYVVSRSQP